MSGGVVVVTDDVDDDGVVVLLLLFFFFFRVCVVVVVWLVLTHCSLSTMMMMCVYVCVRACVYEYVYVASRFSSLTHVHFSSFLCFSYFWRCRWCGQYPWQREIATF